MRLRCYAALVIGVLLLAQQSACADPKPDPYNFADYYAPILEFSQVGVTVYPSEFGGGGRICTYINIKESPSGSGYVFQYWFYYKEDIRWDRQTDEAIKGLLQGVQQHVKLDKLDSDIKKLFHKHDWELVEVHVPRLKEVPSRILYGMHSDLYELIPGKGAPMSGKQCVVKIVTDMHACYPAGPWNPAMAGIFHHSILTEFAFIALKEAAAGYVPFGKWPPPYRTINFAGKTQRFNSRMESTPPDPDYPYHWPWHEKRDYNYKD